MGQGDENLDQDVILKFIQFLLGLWAKDYKTRSDDSKRSLEVNTGHRCFKSINCKYMTVNIKIAGCSFSLYSLRLSIFHLNRQNWQVPLKGRQNHT